MRPRPTPASLNRLVFAGLLLIVPLLTCTLFARWSWSDWVQPRELLGDPLEIFARVKLAAEQPLQPFVGFTELERLGAPFRADWGAYPAPDSVVFFLAGRLAHVIGVFGAVKLTAAVFYLLNAVSFYLCVRRLRWRPEWAAAGALLFAFCNYNVRWSVTLSFNQTFTLPPLVLLCAHAAKTGQMGRRQPGWVWLGGLLGAWIGIGNPYLGFFTGLLAAATLMVALIRRSPWERMRPLVFFIASVLGVFLVANLSYAWYHLTAGDSGPLVRNFAGSLVYALKPMDWLVPPLDHRWAWAARLGFGYGREIETVTPPFFAGYLGLVGLAGLAGLTLVTVHRVAQRPGRPLPDAALGLLLILGFAVAGGLNSILAFAGLDIFRASQRISIFVNIWALLFIIGWLQHRLRPCARWLSIVAALACAAFGWWEQTPHLRPDKARRKLAPQWQAMQDVTRGLEAAVGGKAMIFQLPIRRFPEAGPLNRMMDYEHFQPFLVDSSLRFSYGPLGASRELAWQRFITRLPAAEMVATLEQSGFAAIWINTRAYADGGDRLVRELTALARTEWVHDTGAPVRIVRLRPATTRRQPDLDDLRINLAWADPATGNNKPTLLAVNGWYPLEEEGARRWRWAAKRAEIGIWWPSWKPGATLRFKAAVLRDDTLELRHGGRTILQLPLRRGEIREVEQPLNLTSGSNRLVWLIRGEPTYPPRGDTRKLGFRIENLEIAPAGGERR